MSEQNNVDVIFSGHTHVYSRTCKMNAGACTADEAGLTQMEVGPVGASGVRSINVDTGTVTGTDSDGVSRQDAYNCTTNLEQSQGSSNESCHVQVEDCVAVVDCYRVASGNPIPFDTWAIDHCP